MNAVKSPCIARHSATTTSGARSARTRLAAMIWPAVLTVATLAMGEFASGQSTEPTPALQPESAPIEAADAQVQAPAAAADPSQSPLPPVQVTQEPATIPAAQDGGFADPAAQRPRSAARELFAGTLAAVLQTTGSTLAIGLTQAISGGLTNWFNRRAQGIAGSAAIPTAPPLVASAPLPPPDAPPVIASNEPVQSSTSTTFFDPGTGAVVAPPSTLPAPGAETVVAGLAFEVHVLVPGGATQPVDPATHVFRTGDRFFVFYRPTLPGRMEIFNVNPLGQQTQIETVEIAAGQLAQLGPYEFAGTAGDETLRLVLAPCTTPALIGATRDIVKASDVAGAGGLALTSCNATSPLRSIRTPALPTRDIRKVALDGTTGFALDNVSAGELASGELAPRELTISFRHR